jgi:phage shock protein B
MEDVLIPIVIVGMLFIGLPWIILHYVSKWKSSATLTTEDENLLDELHDVARRLDDRMATIERIIQAENPNWRSIAFDPASTGIEDHRARAFEPDEMELGGRTNQPRRRNS